MSENAETRLKEACQLTAAAWAAVVERDSGHLFIHTAHRLPKSKRATLIRFLSEGSLDAWLSNMFKGTSARPAPLPASAKLGASRLYAFPIPETSRLILVGASKQNAGAQRIWRLIAGLMQDSAENGRENILPTLQTELPYDMPRALERVLSNFTQEVNPQGGWLAIHRGDTLNVMAEFNDARVAGLSLSIESNTLLRRMNRNLVDMAATRERPEWEYLPHALRKSTNYWVCFPLVIGQRLIGAVALWAQAEFTASQIKRLRELARRLAPSVEIIVTFNELTGHLQRLALLNDFVLTVSSAQNLEQIARRVFGLLVRSFSAELI